MGVVNPLAQRCGCALMSWSKRRTGWLLGAVLCGLVVYMAPSPDIDLVAPRPVAHNSAAVNAAAASQGSGTPLPHARLLKINPRWAADDLTPIFADGGGAIEPKVKTKPLEPVPALTEPPVQAPPLSFKFIGRYVEDGKVKVFLQNRDQDMVVMVGDAIGQSYKLDSISSSTLTFTFTPLNEKQTLNIEATP